MSRVAESEPTGRARPAKPTLYVCHGDDGGPRIHPCRRVQEALRDAGIEYDKVIAAHGSPIPFLRKGSRDALRAATGAEKLPALKLPDGPVITHSRAIRNWISRQDSGAPKSVRPAARERSQALQSR
jgi:glutathione S-transferase